MFVSFCPRSFNLKICLLTRHSYLVVIVGFYLAGLSEVDVENPNEDFIAAYRTPGVGFANLRAPKRIEL